jgi:hypothetical protein
MITDIEFRWVKRKIQFDSVNFVNVLQFRKQVVLNIGYGWTNWQDVPVVEENARADS